MYITEQRSSKKLFEVFENYGTALKKHTKTSNLAF
jgi:hypothetical protein